MALTSVARIEIDTHREADPFERITSKLAGIQAISAMANVALEYGGVSDKVWFPLWYFIGEVCDDIQVDAEQMQRQR